METLNDRLGSIQAQLAEIIGPDLADSLVRAGRKGGEFDLDMQLAINDGLESLSPEKKRKALVLLDSLLRQV